MNDQRRTIPIPQTLRVDMSKVIDAITRAHDALENDGLPESMLTYFEQQLARADQAVQNVKLVLSIIRDPELAKRCLDVALSQDRSELQLRARGEG